MRDVIDVHWPLAGQRAATGFENQAPYSTPYSLNTRNRDVFEKRMRGGTRPRLGKMFGQLLGSGNPIRLLNSVNTGRLPSGFSFSDSFGAAAGPLTTPWSSHTLPAGTASVPSGGVAPEASTGILHYSGSAVAAARLSSSPGAGSAILDAIGLDMTAPWSIEAVVRANLDTTYEFIIGLDDSSPDNGNSLSVLLVGTIGSFGAGWLVIWENRTDVVASAAVPFLGAFGNETVNIVSNGTTLTAFLSASPGIMVSYALGTRAGTRIALGLTQTVAYAHGIQRFSIDGLEAAAANPSLVASSNGTVYYESTPGIITTISSEPVDLASDRLLQSGERFGKLYIADYEVRQAATDGAVNGTSFDDAANTDWTTLGIDVDGDMLEILTAGTSGAAATLGIYVIDSFDSSTITLASSAGGDGSNGGVQYRILRAVKVFDSRLSTGSRLVRLTATGSVKVPVGATVCAIWNDRLCLSGDPQNPGDTFMSQQGGPTNWDEDDTSQSPIYGEFDRNSRINEPVRALIPYSADYLVIGGIDTINVLRGNPAAGGIVDQVSGVAGIVDKFAWCVTPDGILVAMSGDGLYMINPSVVAATPLSRDKLPAEFLELGIANNDVQLAFDPRRYGIAIAVTPKVASPGLFYWFDWETRSFHKEDYDPDHHPTAMTTYTQSGEATGTMVWGGRNGYLREHNDSATTDDGVEVVADQLIGPILLGQGGYWEGMLREVVPQFSADSGNVQVSVQVGRSIEDAFRATPQPIGVARAGKGLTMRPNLRGNCCFIRYSSISGSRWAYEGTSVARERLGKQRLLST